jgi:hypothetical protein
MLDAHELLPIPMTLTFTFARAYSDRPNIQLYTMQHHSTTPSSQQVNSHQKQISLIMFILNSGFHPAPTRHPCPTSTPSYHQYHHLSRPHLSKDASSPTATSTNDTQNMLHPLHRIPDCARRQYNSASADIDGRGLFEGHSGAGGWVISCD